MRLKKFVRYYAVYKKQFIPVCAASLVTSVFALLIPLCVRAIAQTALAGKGAYGKIALYSALMLGLIAAEALTNYYFDAYGHALGARMESDLRSELFAHLETLSFSFYDTHSVAALMSGLTNDLLELTELFHHGPEDYVMSIVRLLGACIILARMHVGLTLILLIFVVLMILGTLYWGRRLERISAQNQENIAQINRSASDVLGGIRTVQSYTGEEEQRQRFDRTGRAFFLSRKAIYFNESYADKTTLVFTRLATLAAAAVGACAAAKGALTLPDLLVFIMYIHYVTDPVQRLNWMITQFKTGMAGFDRVMTYMETEPAVKDAAGAVEYTGAKGAVRFEDVHFGYTESNEVLRGLDLDIPAGQLLVIAGVSGSGKTTMAMLPARYYDVTSGRVLCDGRPVTDYTLRSLRGAIAWVQQDTYLFDGTVLENIRAGRPDADIEDVYRAAREADAYDFITALPKGFDSIAGERGVLLSGGQRQRIGLARALLKDAPILILDEATSALDSESERRMYDSLRRVRAGRTTVIIAHRLSAISDTDRVAVLSGGRIVQDGTHAELLAKGGLYANLVHGA